MIDDKEYVKDLRIFMSHNGNFNFYISQVMKKVNKRCDWIHQYFNLNTVSFRCFMWRKYVLGLIDYGS